MRLSCFGLVVPGLLASLLAGPALAQNAAADFRQNCVSCHTIGGGRLVGPDLKGVLDRQSRDWLSRFIVDPKRVIDGGDAYARKLLQESGGVMMPSLPGMSDARARALVDLIETESALEKSQFKGTQVSERPFTPADVTLGRELFTGKRPLKQGGAACLSCHSAGTVALGGALGPDLTKAYERLGGRRGLSSWLSAPATPTMQMLLGSRPLDPEETLSLVAYLETTARDPAPAAASTGRFEFVALGIVGAVAGLSLMNRIWNRRLRGVRRQLVESARLEECV